MSKLNWTAIGASLAIVLTVPILYPGQASFAEPSNNLAAQVMALQGAVTTLQAQLSTLQGQLATANSSISTLQSALAAVQSNKALALGPYVSVDTNAINGLSGPHILFTGANVHIRSGSGATDDSGTLTGLGNLIVGYNELPPNVLSGDRCGSHNLITGPEHRYLSYGGFVAGRNNTISGATASVSGGSFNIANGLAASISGGGGNSASGDGASVSGGLSNTADGVLACVSGGKANIASGLSASVSGGRFNIASGPFSSVSGGEFRSATGSDNWVAGSLFESL